MKPSIISSRIWAIAALGVAMGAYMAMGCGGSSGSATGSDTTLVAASSYAMPNEISAVPTSSAAQSSLAAPLSFKSALKGLTKAATDTGTDYSNAVTRTFVEERTLEQFSILEKVMSAVEQTHFTAEPGNGPFKAVVAFEEEQSKVDTKALQTWIAQADWVDASGTVVADQASSAALRLRAWIEERGEIIRAQFLITTPAERNDDGSYAHYGEWTLNVKCGDSANDWFAASSVISGDDNIITVHERFEDNFPGGDLSAIAEPTVETMAMMHRSATSGYGKVSYPDYDAMFAPGAALTTIPVKGAAYAYDGTYVAIKVGDEATTFKNRTLVVRMTHRYGVFNADTGANVVKSKSFGFPVSNGYYGSWQGRHQLWMGEHSQVSEGTAVTRVDLPPGEEESYVVGPTFNGTLAKRTYINATLDDIKNIPVEIWLNDVYQLIYSAGAWHECFEIDFMTGECAPGQLSDSTFDFTGLSVGENDTKKNVWIEGFNQNTMTSEHFVVVAGDGLYKAQQQDTQSGPRLVSTGVPINPVNVPALFVSIGGSIYVEYKGEAEGWVEKELDSFDTFRWNPNFNDAGDKAFTLPEDRQLYVNMEGANYVINRSGNTVTVQLEIQTVANPVNAATLVPAGTVFMNNWDQAGEGSTYTFVTDSSNPNFLMLTYASVGVGDLTPQGTPDEGVSVGAVVAQSVWGLRATIDGAPVDFNWEYSSEGGWGSVTYLKNTDGSYKLLDDPILFNSVVVTNGAGEQKTLSLKFDGWMHGLPEMFNELEKNNWTITTDIKNKIINIPAGTQVVDAETGVEYLIKPLEQGLFMEVVSDPGNLSLVDAEALDLSTVPSFVDHGMGAVPTDAPLYYSEGECILASHCGAE